MSSQPPPQREAVMIILDVSSTIAPDRFSLAKSVCGNLVQQKLIFAPRDEVGLLLAGSKSTLNRMSISAPGRYENLVVARPIGPASLDIFEHIDRAVQEHATMDMLDALLVAADAIFERTGDRRYQRRVFLVSDVQQTVKRKEELTQLIAFYKKHNLHLIVIGIDFDSDEDTAAASVNEDWDALSPKQQNERVLRFICSDLSTNSGSSAARGESLVVPVSDALEALSALRKRSVGQRAVARCVLSVGDIHIAVHLYTKTLLARIPSLRKTAEKGLVTERKYYSSTNPDVELDASVRVKAYRYGKSVIPFTDVDEAQMKFESERSLTVLGFVPISQIPFHHLMGGVRVVAPAPGDVHGARALSSFVQGMDQLQRAMLVRFVRVTNADPLLGVCVPSTKAERDILYFAPLPFAEDVRHYQFTTYSDVVVAPEEAHAVDRLVHMMTLDKDTLKPSETFNPALQYHYQCVRERYLSSSTADKTSVVVAGGATTSVEEEGRHRQLPEISPALLRTSCHFEGTASCLAATLRAAQPLQRQCKDLFPFIDPEAAADGSIKGKTYWFAAAAGDATTTIDGGVKAERHDGGTTPNSAGGGDRYGGGSSEMSTTPNTASSPALFQSTPMTAQDAAKLTVLSTDGAYSVSTGLHVSTTDPVGTFRKLLASGTHGGGDVVDRALFEMTEVILKLVRSSIGRSLYGKCNECVDVLRSVCVKEDEARCFNKLLINLMCAVSGTDHAPYWTQECVTRGVRPITRLECEDSDVADAAAAEAFVHAARAVDVPVAESDDEEDIFGQLE